MAKRGQFFPYRIKYRYENPDTSGTVALTTPAQVGIRGKEFLRRGAVIKVYSVNPATREQHLITTMTPADLPDSDGMDD